MPPSYRESLDWLTATGSRGIRPGLERVSALLDALGNPQVGLRGALVAGTNGKGSVCAMVESACRAAGLSTVMLVKPHLRSYRERVVIDGQPVSADGFARLVDRLRPAVDAVEPEVGAPTQFEILTALGILAAADRRPDVVICEVGLGGRLDSTNVLDLGVAVITTVALDHRDRLGSTIAEITAEKAGIIKAGNDVVTGASGEALAVIRERAGAVGAERLLALGGEVRVTGRSLGLDGVEADIAVGDDQASLRIPLLGLHQAENAAVALATCAMLAGRGVSLDLEAVRRGLATVRWPARLQWLATVPPLLVDGAHNPAAVEAIVPAVREVVGDRPLVALVGVMADKDVAGIVDALRPLAPIPVFSQAGTPRAARAVDLARLWGHGARAISSLPDALTAARMLAGDEGVVLICGSIYLAGDVLALLDAGDD
ncbi:MAG TPA: folylpolyglutamate synthase/dihydrofolate synthase family protein [Candidatus Dormibacteraeota bacterium]|nr:folylpolyglutamate synthase/dihydrofolate synthase family protein [Candidatus Dormibacteraeota bacterium]